MKAKGFFLLIAPLLLTACAGMQTQQQRTAERAARVQAAAGAPVSHFLMKDRGFYSWNTLNDHQIIVYVTLKEAYLLDLPACPGLETTPGIVVSSNQDLVYKNLDDVTTTQMGIPCPIQQIRPVDLDQVKAARDASRSIKTESREKAHQSMSDNNG